MNFIPNKHELYLINSGISGRERERERERDEFCVIDVKYKEIFMEGQKKKEEKKSNFQKHRGTRA